MGVDQLLAGEVSQPEEKRQWLVLKELREAFGRLQEGFLEDVGVVEAALEVAAEAQADHALEPFAVAREQFRHGRRVARGRTIEQFGKVFWIRHRGDPPLSSMMRGAAAFQLKQIRFFFFHYTMSGQFETDRRFARSHGVLEVRDSSPPLLVRFSSRSNRGVDSTAQPVYWTVLTTPWTPATRQSTFVASAAFQLKQIRFFSFRYTVSGQFESKFNGLLACMACKRSGVQVPYPPLNEAPKL